MTDSNWQSIVGRHHAALADRYVSLKDLSFSKDGGSASIQGCCLFSATFEGQTRDGAFDVEIVVSAAYPGDPPKARAIGGSVPRDFHTNPDGFFCLGAPLDVHLRFQSTPTLVGFTENLLIPFLYSYVTWRDTGRFPFGERSHGGQGLFEHYCDYLGVADKATLIEFLKIIVEDRYHGHLPCPCGSGRRLRHCHGPKLLAAIRARSAGAYLVEYNAILDFLKRSSGGLPPDCVTPRLMKRYRKLIREERKAQSAARHSAEIIEQDRRESA